MYNILRPLLFKLEAETAHECATTALKWFLQVPGAEQIIEKKFKVDGEALKREVFGLSFPNPIGLAAGFDKNADFVDELAALGFGFVEIGTVTPLAQSGNLRPRLFRLPLDKAIINRMGFNNKGVDAVVKNLSKRKSSIIVGGNIGKNKDTPNEHAFYDYEKCFQKLFDFVDYFVVNVSSPNTPGLRELQDKKPLLFILNKLQQINFRNTKSKPVLLKIAPDLSNEQLDDIVDIVAETEIQGVIATNTTISRNGLTSSPADIEKSGTGGLSGAPLKHRSNEVLRYLKEKSGNAFPIIGVGGIMSAEDAAEKLSAGADLIQIYTGFIYEGPGLVRRICEGLGESGKTEVRSPKSED